MEKVCIFAQCAMITIIDNNHRRATTAPHFHPTPNLPAPHRAHQTSKRAGLLKETNTDLHPRRDERFQLAGILPAAASSEITIEAKKERRLLGQH